MEALLSNEVYTLYTPVSFIEVNMRTQDKFCKQNFPCEVNEACLSSALKLLTFPTTAFCSAGFCVAAAGFFEEHKGEEEGES